MTRDPVERPETIRVSRALLSAYHKEAVLPLARGLRELGVELLASGGTARFLETHGVTCRRLEEIVGFAELFGGRLKTLSPKVHGGILLRRDRPEDVAEAREHGILPVDLVAVDLYPYEELLAGGRTGEPEAVEMIDIGGPTLLRAAAKNHAFVVPLCDPADFPQVLEALRTRGGVPREMSLALARKTFARTAAYDAAVAASLGRPEGAAWDPESEWFVLGGRRARKLRYGENPGQRGFLYTAPGSPWEGLRVHQGKEISFNNLGDLVRGAHLLNEFSGREGCAATVLKHGVPAGTAIAPTPEAALERAWAGDELSAFGGVVCLNRPATAGCAEFLRGRFFEILAAPSWEADALEVLAAKKRRILVEWPILAGGWDPKGPEVRGALGGLLVQDPLPPGPDPGSWERVTGNDPGPEVRADLAFAWAVVRHVRSNAIVLAREGRTVGVGAGQTSRIDAMDVALFKARRAGHEVRGGVLASDAFFPFPDVVERAAEAGIVAIVQPGGSIRDEETVSACAAHGLTLYFTRQRVFLH
jgi:phosphoribosylaminoimidazolecarboxamide formyltransferase/IMP cyclohydrolase